MWHWLCQCKGTRTRSLSHEPYHQCYSLLVTNEQAVIEAKQRRIGTSHWQSWEHLTGRASATQT
jgi:hypothetical protein